MAISIVDTLEPKNNGTFPVAKAKDIVMGDGETRLEDKIASMEVTKNTEMSADGIAEANIMYFLGTVESISVGFPETADEGDMVFVSFNTGDTVPTFDITSDNHVGLDNIVLKTNTYYELIGLWNGSKWVFVSHEVV